MRTLGTVVRWVEQRGCSRFSTFHVYSALYGKPYLQVTVFRIRWATMEYRCATHGVDEVGTMGGATINESYVN